MKQQISIAENRDCMAAMAARFKAHTAKPVLFAPEQMYQVQQAKLFDSEILEV